jgi:selenocysteine lyase/cysteine desulfurase
MSASLQKSPPIGEWSGKTPLEDFVIHRTRQTIEALEEELVEAIYQQREWEQEIMSFNPQSHAPAHVVQSFNQSKLKVHAIELALRKVRHSF